MLLIFTNLAANFQIDKNLQRGKVTKKIIEIK